MYLFILTIIITYLHNITLITFSIAVCIRTITKYQYKHAIECLSVRPSVRSLTVQTVCTSFFQNFVTKLGSKWFELFSWRLKSYFGVRKQRFNEHLISWSKIFSKTIWPKRLSDMPLSFLQNEYTIKSVLHTFFHIDSQNIIHLSNKKRNVNREQKCHLVYFLLSLTN